MSLFSKPVHLLDLSNATYIQESVHETICAYALYTWDIVCFCIQCTIIGTQ